MEQWQRVLEVRYGMPVDRIPGTVYVLCLGEEGRWLYSVSNDYPCAADGWGYSSRLIRHYVGWSQLDDPLVRVDQHGTGLRECVASLEPGTLRDEERVKRRGICPRCGSSLVPGDQEVTP